MKPQKISLIYKLDSIAYTVQILTVILIRQNVGHNIRI